MSDNPSQEQSFEEWWDQHTGGMLAIMAADFHAKRVWDNRTAHYQKELAERPTPHEHRVAKEANRLLRDRIAELEAQLSLREIEINQASYGLDAIIGQLQGWLDYDTQQRDKEGLKTEDSTHIYAPTVWLSHGTIKNWIGLLGALRPPLPVPPTEPKASSMGRDKVEAGNGTDTLEET